MKYVNWEEKYSRYNRNGDWRVGRKTRNIYVYYIIEVEILKTLVMATGPNYIRVYIK